MLKVRPPPPQHVVEVEEADHSSLFRLFLAASHTDASQLENHENVKIMMMITTLVVVVMMTLTSPIPMR